MDSAATLINKLFKYFKAEGEWMVFFRNLVHFLAKSRKISLKQGSYYKKAAFNSVS